jgi:hypothetical protein
MPHFSDGFIAPSKIALTSPWVFSALCCIFITPLTSYADIKLDSLKQPMPVMVQESLSTAVSPLQMPVTVTVPDAIHWKDSVIPAQTRLHGTLTQNTQPKRWGRPARMVVTITSVTFPLQPVKALARPMTMTLGLNPYETRRSLATRQLFITGVSRAATIPLYLTTGLGGMAIGGIGSGIGAMMGVGQELQKDDAYDTRSTGRRVAVGALRGATGIPTYVSLLKKNSPLNYQAEELAMAALEKPLWKALFQPCTIPKTN